MRLEDTRRIQQAREVRSRSVTVVRAKGEARPLPPTEPVRLGRQLRSPPQVVQPGQRGASVRTFCSGTCKWLR